MYIVIKYDYVKTGSLQMSERSIFLKRDSGWRIV